MAQHSNPTSTQGGSLTRRERPYHPLDLFRHEMESLFDRFFGDGWLDSLTEEFGSTRGWGFDVDKTDQEIVVRADVPGFEENELDVRLDNDMLTIQAEKEQKGDNQRAHRRFFRQVTLPPGIDAETVQAAYRNGVLELHIPRPKGSQAKRIPVRGQPVATDQASADGGNEPPAGGQAVTQTARK